MSCPRETTRRFGCFGATVTVHVGGRSDDGTEAPLAALLAQGRLLRLHGACRASIRPASCRC